MENTCSVQAYDAGADLIPVQVVPKVETCPRKPPEIQTVLAF